jgi:hypothetical protein
MAKKGMIGFCNLPSSLAEVDAVEEFLLIL